MRHPLALALVALSFLATHDASAQKKPKKALKESDAQRAIAATPGFALNRGRVRVKEISLAGQAPVVVTAEVEVALGFMQVEGEKGSPPRWRIMDFRTGDRSWEKFDYLAGPVSAEAIYEARSALEEMAAEFVSRQRQLNESEKGEETSVEVVDAKGKKIEATKQDKKVEVRRGPLVMKEFAPIYKSARAVVDVEAAFTLERDAKKKWRVVAFKVGDLSMNNLEALIASINRKKSEHARADLETIRLALERFRSERGFYVVSDSETVLVDHLSPRYLKTIIRIDPWHRPYRYNGTRDAYTLSSDGPDNLPLTADDVTLRE